jgi:hypothetical protein
MVVLQVPYHLDEYLPDLDLPLRADEAITADLPSADTWSRLTVLYRPAAVAGALRMLLSTGRVAAVGIACTWHPGHRAAARIGPHLAAALPIGS